MAGGAGLGAVEGEIVANEVGYDPHKRRSRLHRGQFRSRAVRLWSVLWSDPAIGIPWPRARTPIGSDKDAAAPFVESGGTVRLKILLTGRTGQVGWELQRRLASLGEVVAPDRATLDLSRPDTVAAVVHSSRPHLIVNAAAYTAVDRAENEVQACFAVNAESVAVLAQEAARVGALLVHYSTDYVFDGAKRSPYVESDPAVAIDKYVYVTVMRPFTPGIYLKYSQLEHVDLVREVRNHVLDLLAGILVRYQQRIRGIDHYQVLDAQCRDEPVLRSHEGIAATHQ
jgi:hypothetical protein